MARAKTSPCSNDGTDIPDGVEEAEHSASLPRISKLSNHGWASDAGEADSYAEKTSPDHELSIAECRSLDNGSDESEEGTDVLYIPAFRPYRSATGEAGKEPMKPPTKMIVVIKPM